MAENKDRVYVYVEGPFGMMCRVPADKLTQFKENKAKIERGEQVMSKEEKDRRVAEAMASLKKLAGIE